MRALILHANKFATKVVKKSNKPGNIVSEKVNEFENEMDECIVAFFTVEKPDKKTKLKNYIMKLLKPAMKLILKIL